MKFSLIYVEKFIILYYTYVVELKIIIFRCFGRRFLPKKMKQINKAV